MDNVTVFLAGAVAAVAVAFGWVVLKKGWGWVLAKWNARKAAITAKAQAEAASILAPVLPRISLLETTVAALKSKYPL